jgi:hypothetical protein
VALEDIREALPRTTPAVPKPPILIKVRHHIGTLACTGKW